VRIVLLYYLLYIF